MKKDISRLGEAESRKKREGIDGLKTEEQEKQEKELLERAQIDAEERKKAEEEAERRRQELENLITSSPEPAVDKKTAKEQPAEKISEAQKKEEEERRKFLERIEGNIPAGTEPPEIQTPPSSSFSELKKMPEKPSIISRFWIRIVIAFIIIAAIAIAVSAIYWYWRAR